MIVSVLGPPGSGKTTLASLLAEEIGFKLVVAGDVARQLAETDSEVAACLARGDMAPRSKMNNAMLKHLDRHCVLDGYPRYFEQMADLMWAVAMDVPVCFVILTAEDDTVVARMLDRDRGDDTEEVIRRRLEVYKAESEPVIRWVCRRYPTRHVTINAHQSPGGMLLTARESVNWWLQHEAAGGL